MVDGHGFGKVLLKGISSAYQSKMAFEARVVQMAQQRGNDALSAAGPAGESGD
jgi:hypothetical protein